MSIARATVGIRSILEIPPDGPYFGSKIGDLDLYAFSAAGRSHQHEGLASADACSVVETDALLIGVASDGAGSAECGARGAQVLCQCVSRIIAETVTSGSSLLEVCEQMADEWQNVLRSAIEEARRELFESAGVSYADASGETQASVLRPFHATLVGVVISGRRGFFFHLGDGLGMAFAHSVDMARENPEAFKPDYLSLPENSEFANETFFFTMANWRDHVRLSFFQDVSDIAIMTDGVSNLLLDRADAIPARTIVPILEYLPTVDPPRAARTLMNTFTSADANILSSDDKTLLWFARRQI